MAAVVFNRDGWWRTSQLGRLGSCHIKNILTITISFFSWLHAIKFETRESRICFLFFNTKVDWRTYVEHKVIDVSETIRFRNINPFQTLQFNNYIIGNWLIQSMCAPLVFHMPRSFITNNTKLCAAPSVFHTLIIIIIQTMHQIELRYTKSLHTITCTTNISDKLAPCLGLSSGMSHVL